MSRMQVAIEGMSRALILNLTRFRHRARGSSYLVLVAARAQCSTRPIQEGDVCVVYTDHLGQCHVRRYDEFHDGRFEELPDA